MARAGLWVVQGRTARREEILEMPVIVAMRKQAGATPKVVAANQKAIDERFVMQGSSRP